MQIFVVNEGRTQLMLVYRMSPEIEKVFPVGAIYSWSKNGWINEELFLLYLQNFKNSVKPSNDDSVLIMDNHASHTSLCICNYCKIM
jgi:hypothetical protein